MGGAQFMIRAGIGALIVLSSIVAAHAVDDQALAECAALTDHTTQLIREGNMTAAMQARPQLIACDRIQKAALKDMLDENARLALPPGDPARDKR